MLKSRKCCGILVATAHQIVLLKGAGALSRKRFDDSSMKLKEMLLTEQECNLIQAVRTLGSGEERVIIKDSKIVQIEEMKPSDDDMNSLSVQERKIIEIVRDLDYGEERVVVKDSEIVQIEEKKSIKL